MQDILNRLEVIEKRLQISSHHLAPEASIEEQSVLQAKQETTAPQPAEHPAPSRYFTASNILGFAGFLCFFFAGAFMVLVAIDAGWLTPVRQCFCGTLLGALLIWAGLILKEKDHRFASFLPAAGIGCLYAAVYAALLQFQLIQATTALFLLSSIGLFSIYLFTIFRSDLFAVISTIGSYTVPVVLGTAAGSFGWISLYFLIWTTVYGVLSVVVKSRSVTLLASYLGIGLYAFLSFGERDYQQLVAIVQLSQFLVLFAATVSFSITNQASLSQQESLYFYPILLFFYGSLFDALHVAIPPLAPYVMIAIALVMAFGFALVKRTLKEASGSAALVQAYCALTFIQAVYFEILTDATRPALLVILLVASFFLPKSQKSFFQSVLAQGALFLIAISEYFSLISTLCSSTEHQPVQWFFVVYGFVLSFLFTFKGIRSGKEASNQAMIYFILGHSIGLSALYGVFSAVGSIAITMSWILYGALILWIGFTNTLKVLSKSSVFILLFAFFKLFTYDVAEADILIRFTCFLCTGIALFGSGWIHKKIESLEP